jgi:lipoprotein-anchoring transpeptidase ErfK/SrfK
MYWQAKVVLVLLAVLLIGGVLFIFRDRLPSLPGGGEDPPPPLTAVSTGTGEQPANPGGVTPASVNPAVPVPPPPAAVSPETLQRVMIARQHLQAGDPMAARRLVENAIKDPATVQFSPDWRRLAEVLSEANTKLLLSDIPCPEKELYTVVNGDSLWRIATRNKTTIALLQRGNRLDETSHIIAAGQTLSVYKANWRIEVSKKQNVLLLKDGERLVKLYDVATGRQDRTPAGKFVVENKQREPAWTPPGKNIPYGNPENVLGTRWLGLRFISDTPGGSTHTGYGIHGTWEPESIGKMASNGCVRMLNADVEELFDLIPEGVPVEIFE